MIRGTVIAVLLCIAMPRAGSAASEQFGDIVVRYNAIPSAALYPAAAKAHGIVQSAHNGLVNISVEQRAADGSTATIAARIDGTVGDLTGHPRPIRFRETKEAGAIDYLGEFAIDASGTCVFTIDVTPAGRGQPYTLRFNHDFVVD